MQRTGQRASCQQAKDMSDIASSMAVKRRPKKETSNAAAGTIGKRTKQALQPVAQQARHRRLKVTSDAASLWATC
jgi:hypothetical protein